MKVSIVIPCYNEADNIPALLERCALITASGEVEIILVDNGSTDETQKTLNEKLPFYRGCRSIRIELNQGYGYGILSGLQAAQGQILGWTHADLQTDPNDIVKGLEYFERFGIQIFVKGKRQDRPIADVIFTSGMSLFETLLFGRRLSDINAQPTMFSKTFFDSWQDPPFDFSLDLYAYYHASKAGLSIHRFPVLFGERVHGVSHWNVNWKAKVKFIRRTFRYSLELKRNN